MRVLVCGSRTWHDEEPIRRVLDGYARRRDELVVIEGAAVGADTIAASWARAWDIELYEFPADWTRYGRGAGPRRNIEMLRDGDPDVVWAFRSAGRSAGTDDMVRRARAAGVPTYVVQ